MQSIESNVQLLNNITNTSQKHYIPIHYKTLVVIYQYLTMQPFYKNLFNKIKLKKIPQQLELNEAFS